MASTAIITFNPSVDVDALETIIITINTGVSNIVLTEQYRDLRTGIGQVTLDLDAGFEAINNANNYYIAWNLDYSSVGSSQNLIATVSSNVVTITLANNAWQFVSVTGTSIDNTSTSAVISNVPVEDGKSLEITNYSKDIGNECTNMVTELTIVGGNNLYNIYVNNSSISTSQTSPVDIVIDRNIINSIRVTDTLGILIGTITNNSNRKVLLSDITPTIENLSGGATLNIKVSYISDDVSVYQYSLDNVTYQSSNVYTGLAVGTYTIYIKDGFDCIISKTGVVIDGVTIVTDTVFEISSINPFRFSLINSYKKNHLNTISCNELRLVKYPFVQKYLLNDIITTQFRTNANYINCFTLDSEGNTNTLSAVQRTENTGLEAKSTCTYFNLGDNKSAIYFGAVDLLNPITDAVIGDTNFGFTLPEWANTKDNYVTIQGIGMVKIDNIGYSEFYQSFILEFNISYTGNPVERKISAKYNLQPYEIYEFTTTMIDEPEKFNVVIEVGTASDNILFSYVSESVKRVEDSDFLFKINYYDSENKGGMNYQTGIKHLIRLNGYVDSVGEQKTEGYDGDKDFYVTDNSVYDSQKFTFLRLSSEMAHKLRLIFSHQILEINGLFYKIAEVPEITGNANFNLKNFSVTLKRGGDQFLTDAQQNITNTSEGQAISGGIEGSEGKSLLLWTKTNG